MLGAEQSDEADDPNPKRTMVTTEPRMFSHRIEPRNGIGDEVEDGWLAQALEDLRLLA